MLKHCSSYTSLYFLRWYNIIYEARDLRLDPLELDTLVEVIPYPVPSFPCPLLYGLLCGIPLKISWIAHAKGIL